MDVSIEFNMSGQLRVALGGVEEILPGPVTVHVAIG